jgi:RNA polymerase sigma-70 factor, ECF subfamily
MTTYLPVPTFPVMPAPPMAQEQHLIQEILQGRRERFGDLIQPHLRPLSRMIQGAIGARAEVEDIIQQAAMKAFVGLRRFRGDASFRTWLVRIGLNEARQWRRRGDDARFLPLDMSRSHLMPADESFSPSGEFQRNEIAARLRSAAARLPEKYRAIVEMDLLEIGSAESARRLGVNIATVKTRRLRARKRMARILKSRPQAR